MASFSLELDGIIDSDHLMDFTEDPFINAGISQSQNRSNFRDRVVLDPQYSDISDAEDFEIPCSQRRPPKS